MRTVLCFLLLAVGVCQMRLIVVRTGPEKLYNFFPFEWNCIKLSVQADCDLHIVLTDSYSLDESGYYEIVLGAGNNTRSSIRKGPGKDGLSTERKGPVLENGTVSYYIDLNDCDGSITVSKFLPRYNNTIIRLDDPNYQKKSVFGIATDGGRPANWTFTLDWNQDCNSCGAPPPVVVDEPNI